MQRDIPLTGYAGPDGATVEASSSGVTWPAILGGAFASAGLGLTLMVLGAGFGLAAVSPWSNAGMSLTAFGATAAVWLIIVQWVSSGIGGYLTGRLRTKWAGLHTHEVFFRDTANGFLSWAVGSVIAAGFLSLALSGLGAGGAHLATTGAVVARCADPLGYFVDALYRADRPVPLPGQDPDAATRRMLLAGLGNSEMSAADRTYLVQMVVVRTGLSPANATIRVDEVLRQERAVELKARDTADRARKAAASLSIFTALAMLIGAFIASAAGAIGGRQRDRL